MSFPYSPSPLYLYRRSKFHAPRPAIMAGFGNYTHGVFSDGEKYAIPDYVLDEKTGLEGCIGCNLGSNLSFNGYESDNGECNINNFKNKLVDVISGVFPFPANSIVKSIINIELSRLSDSVFTELLNLSEKGYSSFKSYFDKYVKERLLNQIKASSELSFISNILLSLIDEATKEVYNYAVSFLKSCKGISSSKYEVLIYTGDPSAKTLIEQARTIQKIEEDRRAAEILKNIQQTEQSTSQDFTVPSQTKSGPNITPIAIGAIGMLAYLLMR